FVTEEVWSWWQSGSVHQASWPVSDELPDAGDPALLDAVAAALVGIRGAKSQAKASMKTAVTAAEISGPADALALLRLAEADLRAVGRLSGTLRWLPGDGPLAIVVELEGQH
ncbi:MAG: valine--tRNA ligase, partial [Propionicimonas sp.]